MGEERRALLVLLHGVRTVDRSCLLRASVNQQLAGSREGRQREREKGCTGSEMQHAEH